MDHSLYFNMDSMVSMDNLENYSDHSLHMDNPEDWDDLIIFKQQNSDKAYGRSSPGGWETAPVKLTVSLS